MQALILAGGEGTRLRPLTSTVPKPVVPLVDRPFIAFMLDWLRGHGVDDVVMSCGFLADGVRNVLGDGSRYGVRLRYVEEPSRSAPAARSSTPRRCSTSASSMLNGDVLTDIDLTRPARASTSATRRAGDAGAVPGRRPVAPTASCDSTTTARSTEFVEKPAPDQIDTNLINAGAYVLEREVLDADRRRAQPVSIEREVFPQLVGDGLYGYAAERLLARHRHARALPAGHLRHPRGRRAHRGRPPSGCDGAASLVADGGEVAGRVIGPGARREPTAGSPPARVVGSRARARPRRERGRGRAHRELPSCSTAPRSARAARGSARAIIGAGRAIGDRCRDRGRAVLGEGVTVGAGNVLTGGARIFPGVTLPDGAIAF